MSHPTTLQPEAPRRTRRGVALGIAATVSGLVAVLAITFLVGLSGGPSTVPRITFVNPTAYSLSVEVNPGAGAGWTSAGFVPKESTTGVEEVPDQGDVWVFRFDGQGEHGGELRRTREELERDGWHIEIPDEVGERLAAAGAPPTP